MAGIALVVTVQETVVVQLAVQTVAVNVVMALLIVKIRHGAVI